MHDLEIALVIIGGVLGALAAVIPEPKAQKYLLALAIVLIAVGVALRFAAVS